MLAGLASPPSDFLRDYALGKRLGEGAYGQVFEATAITAAGIFASLQGAGDWEEESRLAPKSFAVKRIEKQDNYWDTFVHDEVGSRVFCSSQTADDSAPPPLFFRKKLPLPHIFDNVPSQT